MSEVAIAGPRAVEALLRHAPDRVQRVLYTDPIQGARARVVGIAQDLGKRVAAERAAELDRLAHGVRHQGLVALAQPADYAEWSALLTDPAALLVAVDQVTDPQNLGALLRAGEALGATGALVTSHRCARLGPTVTRTSAGASEVLPVAMATNLARALREARDAGLQVLGADLAGAEPWSVDWTAPTVLVIGSEGDGLRRLTRETCSALIRIPLAGVTESLNAASAGAVLLYEAARQRIAAQDRDRAISPELRSQSP